MTDLLCTLIFLLKKREQTYIFFFFPPCRRCLSAKALIKKQSSRISPYYHLTGSLHTYWRNISHRSESITKADFHRACRKAILNFSETLFWKYLAFLVFNAFSRIEANSNSLSIRANVSLHRREAKVEAIVPLFNKLNKIRHRAHSLRRNRSRTTCEFKT